MKKKLSLSDYTSRKKKNEALAQAQAQHTSTTAGPSREDKTSAEPPSLLQSSSTVIEELDMPSLPISEQPTTEGNAEQAAEINAEAISEVAAGAGS